MTRRDFIAAASAMAAGLALPGEAVVVKSAAAARSTILSNTTDAEEEMYKELYKALVGRTIADATEGNNDITFIGRNAFNMCTALTIANFPNVTEIAQGCFQDCNHLASFIAPNLLTIGPFSLQRCTALTTISAPSVTTIGQAAFETDISLTSVSFPNCTILQSGGNFNGCTILKEAHVPLLNSYLGGDTFKNCNNIELIELGVITTFYSGFTNIGSAATTKTDGDGNEYKCLVTLNMTTSAAMGTNGFPGNAPTTTKFQCSDGYIIYDSATSAWKAVVT